MQCSPLPNRSFGRCKEKWRKENKIATSVVKKVDRIHLEGVAVRECREITDSRYMHSRNFPLDGANENQATSGLEIAGLGDNVTDSEVDDH